METQDLRRHSAYCAQAVRLIQKVLYDDAGMCCHTGHSPSRTSSHPQITVPTRLYRVRFSAYTSPDIAPVPGQAPDPTQSSRRPLPLPTTQHRIFPGMHPNGVRNVGRRRRDPAFALMGVGAIQGKGWQYIGRDQSCRHGVTSIFGKIAPSPWLIL